MWESYTYGSECHIKLTRLFGKIVFLQRGKWELADWNFGSFYVRFFWRTFQLENNFPTAGSLTKLCMDRKKVPLVLSLEIINLVCVSHAKLKIYLVEKCWENLLKVRLIFDDFLFCFPDLFAMTDCNVLKRLHFIVRWQPIKNDSVFKITDFWTTGFSNNRLFEWPFAKNRFFESVFLLSILFELWKIWKAVFWNDRLFKKPNALNRFFKKPNFLQPIFSQTGWEILEY